MTADPACPTWTYERELSPTYRVRARTAAFSAAVSQPAFYNAAAPPEADTAWPTQNAAPRLRLLEYDDLLVYPAHVLVDPRRGRVLPITFKKHRHHRHNGVVHLGQDTFELRDEALRFVSPRRLDRPAYIADTEYPGIYGHDLVEVFTASWAWRHTDGDALFVTSTRRRDYLVTLLGAVGVPASSLFFFDEPLEAPRLYFPEAPAVARRYVHPVAFELFERARECLYNPTLTTPTRIYVSRSRIASRALINEHQVERIAEDHGFTVVHPQNHSIAEQITLFANAEMIMGTSGSAMHNTVFASPGARILMVASASWLTVIDTLLDRGMGRLGYVLGQPEAEHPVGRRRHRGRWVVDPREVGEAVARHFDL